MLLNFRLITVLYWSIQTAVIDYQKSVVMTLFLFSFEPYVHMTELWIHAGILVDENKEFVISSFIDDSTILNIHFNDVYTFLNHCNLIVPPILEYLIHFLGNCDWKVFVASQMNNDIFTLCEVPRGL